MKKKMHRVGVKTAKKKVRAANRGMSKARGRLTVAKEELCAAEKRQTARRAKVTSKAK